MEQPPRESRKEAIGMRTTFRVNNTAHELSADPRLTLLDALRDVIGLTGTKKGCDQGACGACTVVIDGERVLSCLTLAADCDGQQIVTIEGLATGDELHPMQAAFLHCDGFQCGYCTPGRSFQPSARSRRCTRACLVMSRETFDRRSTPRP
jgi:xanthine dehydrogenase YagT iron-sulfur-binding subunit